MKSLSIFLLLITVQGVCIGQFDNSNKRDSIKVLDAKTEYYNLAVNSKEHPGVQLPYDTIEFKDVRYDTSFIAMKLPLLHVSRTFNIKINLDDGLANNLSKYFNSFYSTVDNGQQKRMICYVKKFYVTRQNDFLEHFNAGDLQDDITSQVTIEIECFYKRGDTLFPAVRFDTSYTHHISDPIDVPYQIKQMLQPFMNKIENINLVNVEKRKAYNEAEIQNRYLERFNLPILTTTTYKKGIYRNFNEFKNNAPSIDSFKISVDQMKVNTGDRELLDLTSLAWKAFQTKNSAVFLYDKNNNLISPSNIFGYCDGKTLWIQHGAFFYPLEKTGNAFEFMYAYHYADSYYRTNTLFILTPLNMETGHSN
jgi:hypothetical protein